MISKEYEITAIGQVLFEQSEASRQTNISQGNIGQALNGKRTQSGGYKWQ